MQIQVVDLDGALGVQTFDLEVRAPNLPPEFVAGPITEIIAGEVYRYDADAIDSDPLIIYTLLSAPPDMAVDLRSGVVVWRTGPQRCG